MRAFVQKLASESERATVMPLDVALESVLRAYLHPPTGSHDDLFDPDRALGSLSAKISISYRLGLIDREVEHALQMPVL